MTKAILEKSGLPKESKKFVSPTFNKDVQSEHSSFHFDWKQAAGALAGAYLLRKFPRTTLFGVFCVGSGGRGRSLETGSESPRALQRRRSGGSADLENIESLQRPLLKKTPGTECPEGGLKSQSVCGRRLQNSMNNGFISYPISFMATPGNWLACAKTDTAAC